MESLIEGGQYQWRRNGELHQFNPKTIHKLQRLPDQQLRNIQRVQRADKRPVTQAPYAPRTDGTYRGMVPFRSPS